MGTTLASSAAPALLLIIAIAVSGCPARKADANPKAEPVLRATDGRLEIRAGFPRGIKKDRVSMRTIELTFKNTSGSVLRVFLPKAEAFRTDVSTLVLFSEAGTTIGIHEPHPHGNYVASDADFFMLPPGEERTITQGFTLDPVEPGSSVSARRLGFEAGRTVDVRWTFENKDDVFFGGKAVKHIWTGKLLATGTWTIAD